MQGTDHQISHEVLVLYAYVHDMLVARLTRCRFKYLWNEILSNILSIALQR